MLGKYLWSTKGKCTYQFISRLGSMTFRVPSVYSKVFLECFKNSSSCLFIFICQYLISSQDHFSCHLKNIVFIDSWHAVLVSSAHIVLLSLSDGSLLWHWWVSPLDSCCPWQMYIVPFSHYSVIFPFFNVFFLTNTITVAFLCD